MLIGGDVVAVYSLCKTVNRSEASDLDRTVSETLKAFANLSQAGVGAFALKPWVQKIIKRLPQL